MEEVEEELEVVVVVAAAAAGVEDEDGAGARLVLEMEEVDWLEEEEQDVDEGISPFGWHTFFALNRSSTPLSPPLFLICK